MDIEHEISMSEVDAVEAIKADPRRYSFVMVDVVDAMKKETVSMRKTEALKRVSEDPSRFSMAPVKPVVATPVKPVVVPQK